MPHGEQNYDPLDVNPVVSYLQDILRDIESAIDIYDTVVGNYRYELDPAEFEEYKTTIEKLNECLNSLSPVYDDLRVASRR